MDKPASSLRRSAARYLNADMAYLLKSGFWLNLGTVVNLLFSFALSILFANFLPKEIYGTYQYLLSLLSILTAFTLTGMNSAVIRSVAQGYEGSLRASIKPQLIWSLGAVVVAFLMGGYYLLHADLRLGLGILAIGIALPFITTFNTYGAYLLGKKAFRAQFFYSTLSSLAYYFCIFLAVAFFPGVLPLIVVNVLVSAVTAFVAYRHTLRTFRPGEQVDPDLTTYGGHLSVMNLLGTVAGQIDNLLVFHFLGPVDLAVYSIATLIPERLSGFLKNMTTSVITRFAEQSLKEIRVTLARTAAYFMTAILISSALYAFILPYFFALVYPKYLDAVPYSQVFILTLVVAVGNLIGTVLLAHRRIKGLYALNTAMPIAQIGLQIVGILTWGLWGLVIARVASSVFFVLASIWVTWHGALSRKQAL